ncbi:hypothetical protein A1I_04180 [Rickettsia bellii OSU 85-389]|nr:hypothetical protein A1I_04180 [Rickettsia bellii OSU 85-389]
MFPQSFNLNSTGIGQCHNNTIIIGENSLDYSGYSINTINDLNGDGKPELIIGATGYPSQQNAGQGAIYIVSGNAVNLAVGGSISLTGWNTTGKGIFRLLGENNFDDSSAISSIADLNSGDGKPELIIGAYGFSSISLTCCSIKYFFNNCLSAIE